MNRSIALSLIGVVALVSSASAADIYSSGGSFKDTPVLIPVNTWAGFYIGVNGGGGWSAENNHVILDVSVPPTVPPIPFDRFGAPQQAGGFGGGQIGYNWQWDRFVFGIEGDIQGADISGSLTSSPLPFAPTFARVSSDLNWFGTVRGRLGYSFGSALLYVTGGVAAGGVKDSVFDSIGGVTLANVSKQQTETGFVVGAGLEYAFSPAWSIKAEYQFISLTRDRLTGEFDSLPGTLVRTNNFDHDFNTVRVGLNYHFHDYAPLPLK